jgi:hypothetical protein
MKSKWLIALAIMSMMLVLVGCQPGSFVVTPVSNPTPITTPSPSSVLVSVADNPSAVPTVISNVATSVTSISASLNGCIVDIGRGNVITCRGFQWGLSSKNYTSNWTESGNYPVGNFTYTLSSLSGNTIYYYRAFTTSSAGTGYGAELSVTTLVTPTVRVWDSPYYWVAPSKIDIVNMYSGANTDTWVKDNVLPNGYRYEKGEPICITIYNNAIVDAPYIIELDNGDYGQPVDYADWISVSAWNPLVPARSVMNIPVRIQISNNVTESIPHQWEFRLNVIPGGQGTIQYALTVRFVVTMR